MKDVIKGYLGEAKIGRRKSYKNLALFSLLSTYSLDMDYLILDEALSQGLMNVVEMGEEGSVTE